MVILSNIVRIVMFKFPSRSPGAKYSSGPHSRGSRNDIRQHNFNKRNKNSSLGINCGGTHFSDSCGCLVPTSC